MVSGSDRIHGEGNQHPTFGELEVDFYGPLNQLNIPRGANYWGTLAVPLSEPQTHTWVLTRDHSPDSLTATKDRRVCSIALARSINPPYDVLTWIERQ